MGLLYAPFAAEPRVVDAATRPGRWFVWGEKGHGVKVLQTGLYALGLPLRISLKDGVPDGILGDETYGAIRKFQEQAKLTVDGLAGQKTVTEMDARLARGGGGGGGGGGAPGAPGGGAPGGGAPGGGTPGGGKGPKPQPGPVLRPPTQPGDDKYIIGTAAPHLPSDAGSGPWRQTWPRPHTMLMAIEIRKGLYVPAAYATAYVTGWNAIYAMRHYFNNTGTDFTFDIDNLLKSSAYAKRRLTIEINQARKFCERLPPGRFNITSKKIDHDYVTKSDSQDWYFALSGYQVWGKGTVQVTKGPDGKRKFDLTFEHKIHDPYNWNQGMSAEIAGITVTDDWVGQFHREGLAREFRQYGTAHRRVTWTEGEKLDPAQVHAPTRPGTGK